MTLPLVWTCSVESFSGLVDCTANSQEAPGPIYFRTAARVRNSRTTETQNFRQPKIPFAKSLPHCPCTTIPLQTQWYCRLWGSVGAPPPFNRCSGGPAQCARRSSFNSAPSVCDVRFSPETISSLRASVWLLPPSRVLVRSPDVTASAVTTFLGGADCPELWLLMLRHGPGLRRVAVSFFFRLLS